MFDHSEQIIIGGLIFLAKNFDEKLFEKDGSDFLNSKEKKKQILKQISR